MRSRILTLLLASTLLTGCFPRHAHYEGDPAAPAMPQPRFDGPTADVPQDRLEAFIRVNNPFLSKELVQREAAAIIRCATAEGIPTSLLVGLICTESSFDPKAVSPMGAQGLGQLMPATAKDMGVSDPFDPESNIAGTAKYVGWLGRYWSKHPRRWEIALASYLAGVGTVGSQLKAGKDLTGEQAGYVRKILQLATRV